LIAPLIPPQFHLSAIPHLDSLQDGGGGAIGAAFQAQSARDRTMLDSSAGFFSIDAAPAL
jgi:hypothetical protein